jgi:PII-like signaling protein
MRSSDGFQLTIYLNQDDLIGRHVAVDVIVREALSRDIGGATIIRAAEGFGSHRHLERGRLLSTEDGLGSLIICVDTSSDALLGLAQWVGTQLPGTFATLTPTLMLALGPTGSEEP